MASKLLKDITYPDYPQMIEVRVINKWYTRGNSQQFSYLFVDITGYAIEAQAFAIDETHFDRIVTLQQCYKITNYTTIKGRAYAAVVPHTASIRISRRTDFQLVTNESIPIYYFNFVPLEKLEERLARGSPLSDFVGRAESITDMIPTTEKRTGNTIYLRRVIIMDDRTRTVEVTLWEEKGRAVDKAAALHQIVAVTGMFASKFLRDIQLTSTNATMFFIDLPIPNLEQLKQRFNDLPHKEATVTRATVSTSDMEKIVVSDLHTKRQPQFNRVQFLCEATIAKIFGYRSWFYLACQHCSHSVNQEMTKEGNILWRCVTHETMDKPLQLYILNTIITYDTGSAEAIFFNSAVEQLTGIPCHELIAKDNNIDPKVLPNEIKELCGQRMQLQVTVRLDGSINVNRIIDAHMPLSSPHLTIEPSSSHDPSTPAAKKPKRLSEHSSVDPTELLSSSKKSKSSSGITQD